PAHTVTSTLSLHDALPIFGGPGLHAHRDEGRRGDEHDLRPEGGEEVDVRARHPRVEHVADDDDAQAGEVASAGVPAVGREVAAEDRKSTRLNSSHVKISYA